MEDFHQRAVLVLEAHAILRILPRCLNPVAPTIRVMERRNATRAVRHRRDFQRRIRHRRHRNFIADRTLYSVWCSEFRQPQPMPNSSLLLSQEL